MKKVGASQLGCLFCERYPEARGLLGLDSIVVVYHDHIRARRRDVTLTVLGRLPWRKRAVRAGFRLALQEQLGTRRVGGPLGMSRTSVRE